MPAFDFAGCALLGGVVLLLLLRGTRGVGLLCVSDEFHQSFVPGRFPSIWDVLIFDNLGAVISLWLVDHYIKQKRPDVEI